MVVDLTGVAVAVVGGVFSILGPVALAMVNSHIKDETARNVLDKAITNSLGAMQQAAEASVAAARPSIPNVPDHLAPGVQYVLDHAGGELSRLGVTPEAVAGKIQARMGLANIQHNLAVTASATPTVAHPLAAVAAPNK